LCSFDSDITTDIQLFRTIFAPNGRDDIEFAVTNPQLMHYNIFHHSRAGEVVQFEVQIPYPFIIIGDPPIKAYSNLTVIGDSKRRPCYAHPNPETTSASKLT
jgi:hypothetical protein